MIKQENGYSLWLRPKQTEIDELAKIISKLSHRYRSTPFPPHITLLPSISTNAGTIKKICKQIIEGHSTFNITLDEIEYTKAYFKNLYILTKSQQHLIYIYEDVKKRLEYNTSDVFIPHVSLFYGKLDSKKQHNLREELRNRYPKVLHCQRLDLYNTTGIESEWHLIDSFKLKNNYSTRP